MDAEAIYPSAIAVPFHVPVATLPKVVIFAVPAHVDTAVFSTLFKERSVLTSVVFLPSIPVVVNLA